MSATRLAYRYAKSLLDLAVEKGQVAAVHSDIETFSSALKSRDLMLLVKSPTIHADRKSTVLKAIFGGKFNSITTEFIDIVMQKHRGEFLPDIIRAFSDQYKQHVGIVTATLVLASPVADNSLLEQVKKIIIQQTGKKTVELTTEVDPTILGGFVLRFEDKLYNASIGHKLDLLKKEFMVNKYVREF